MESPDPYCCETDPVESFKVTWIGQDSDRPCNGDRCDLFLLNNLNHFEVLFEVKEYCNYLEFAQPFEDVGGLCGDAMCQGDEEFICDSFTLRMCYVWLPPQPPLCPSSSYHMHVGEEQKTAEVAAVDFIRSGETSIEYVPFNNPSTLQMEDGEDRRDVDLTVHIKYDPSPSDKCAADYEINSRVSAAWSGKAKAKSVAGSKAGFIVRANANRGVGTIVETGRLSVAEPQSGGSFGFSYEGFSFSSSLTKFESSLIEAEDTSANPGPADWGGSADEGDPIDEELLVTLKVVSFVINGYSLLPMTSGHAIAELTLEVEGWAGGDIINWVPNHDCD